MSDNLRDALEDLASAARVLSYRIRTDAYRIGDDIRNPRLTMENHARDLKKLAEKIDMVAAAHPVEPAGVSDEAVEAAATACHESDFAWSSEGIHDEYWRKMGRAALEAALPHLRAQPVASRERVAEVAGVSDEAVAEIAGRMFDGDLTRQPQRVQDRVWRDARAALEAAQPFMGAS